MSEVSDFQVSNFSDFHILDVINMNWMEMKTYGEIPRPRAGHCAVINKRDNKLMIFGGLNKDGFLDAQFLEITLNQADSNNLANIIKVKKKERRGE